MTGATAMAVLNTPELASTTFEVKKPPNDYLY